MTTVRTCLTTAAIAAAALAIGGCGASDEEQIREVAKEFVRLDTKKDAQRTCELLTARAEAQLTAFVGGGECVKAMRKLDSDEDRPSARELNKAKVRVRGDRALLAFGEQSIGLRKADGDWQVDNVLNASLDEQPRRFPAGLSAGSDARQVRATMTALAAAYADADYDRACALFELRRRGADPLRRGVRLDHRHRRRGQASVAAVVRVGASRDRAASRRRGRVRRRGPIGREHRGREGRRSAASTRRCASRARRTCSG